MMNITNGDFLYNLHYIEHNKIEFKGVILNVTPEFIQDANAGTITWDEAVNHILSLYNKHTSVIREYKINQILGDDY